VKDFLLHARSGRIAFIVVAAPNAGDQLHVLPPNALQPSSSGTDFTAQMDQAAFQATPTMSQQELESGNLPANVTGSAGGQGGQLIRATQLTSKLVSSAGQEAGAIDEVGIDLKNGTASLLFRTNPQFAGAERQFEVPLSRFEFGAGQQLTTRLTRADFAQVSGSNISAAGTQPSTAAATSPSASQPTTTVWPGSAPTGRDSAASPEVTNYAAAIRSALAADPNLVREDVSVHAAGNKVMLRGQVSSEAVKNQIESLARAHAGSIPIDNNVRVAH